MILMDQRLKTSAIDRYYTSGEMAPLYDLSTSNLSLVHNILPSDHQGGALHFLARNPSGPLRLDLATARIMEALGPSIVPLPV